MYADVFWILAMAINVYLTFFYKFDAERLRGLEKYYLIINYGLPAIPAFTFLFIKGPSGNKAYGNAVLWCWLTNEFDAWRVILFYGPVW